MASSKVSKVGAFPPSVNKMTRAKMAASVRYVSQLPYSVNLVSEKLDHNWNFMEIIHTV